MLRPRRELLHSDGITDQKSLQRTSATKSVMRGQARNARTSSLACAHNVLLRLSSPAAPASETIEAATSDGTPSSSAHTAFRAQFLGGVPRPARVPHGAAREVAQRDRRKQDASHFSNLFE